MRKQKQFIPDFRSQIEILAAALDDFGYDLVQETDAEDRVEFDEVSTIYINSRCHPETRFYTILHEIGHILISEQSEEFTKNHPMYVHASGCSARSSGAYKVSLIAEEIEAWKKGRQFGKALGLYIDDGKYNKHMTESVMSYIYWAGE